jgi:hypothetical protein
MNKHAERLNDVIRESLVMNERLSAVAMTAGHGDPIACVAADSVLNSQRKTVMPRTSIPSKTSLSLHLIIALCLCLSTGCAFSKNLLGKSKLAQPVLPAPVTANPEMAKADCAAPSMPPRANALTALPVAPLPATQAVANVAPVNNGTQQQPVIQQQPVAQQPIAQQPVMQQQPVAQQPVAQQPVAQQPVVQQPVVLSAAPQQAPATLQPPVQQHTSQQVAQVMPPVADLAATTQAQGQTAEPIPTATAFVPEQSELTTPGLPPATVQAGLPGSKAVSGPELSAAPASAFRAQAHSGSSPAVVCPPGMVPNYGYLTEAISPPEKMAECEKQVHEMNQKLSELQLDTLKARTTMEQMAKQQRQLLLDNEQLRRRAEVADQRYLEELDSLSAIVGEVVSQTGSANKSNPAAKPSRGTNPLRPVPQSAAGQSL